MKITFHRSWRGLAVEIGKYVQENWSPSTYLLMIQKEPLQWQDEICWCDKIIQGTKENIRKRLKRIFRYRVTERWECQIKFSINKFKVMCLEEIQF